MDDLDFSAITDDQLIGLLRATLQEAVRRNPAVTQAARAACLDEQEKATIAKEAAEREAAMIRAKERERVAKEAAERVRRQAEMENGQAKREAARQAATTAAAKIRAEAAEQRSYLDRLARCLDLAPESISVFGVPGRQGCGRIVINRGSDRYSRDHLADYDIVMGSISTTRAYVGRKAELVEILIELYESLKGRIKRLTELEIIGEELCQTN